MYANADVRMGKEGQPDADKGERGKNYQIFADILYGWPLTCLTGCGFLHSSETKAVNRPCWLGDRKGIRPVRTEW